MKNPNKLFASSALVAAALATAPHSAQGVQKEPRADMSVEIKAAIGDLTKTFEEFKAANDKRFEDMAKGFDDVINQEKVDKINAAMDAAQDKINEIVEKQAKHELGMGAGPDAIDYVKAAKEFAILTKQDDDKDGDLQAIAPEDYKAYSENLVNYYRNGTRLPQDIKALLEVGSDPDGGYTVPVDSNGRMVKKIYDYA